MSSSDDEYEEFMRTPSKRDEYVKREYPFNYYIYKHFNRLISFHNYESAYEFIVDKYGVNAEKYVDENGDILFFYQMGDQQIPFYYCEFSINLVLYKTNRSEFETMRTEAKSLKRKWIFDGIESYARNVKFEYIG